MTSQSSKSKNTANKTNTAADKVAELNSGGVALMAEWIKTALNEFRKKRGETSKKIRILDIGCGNSPYFRDVKFTRDEVELIFWDNAKGATYKPDTRGDFYTVDFPTTLSKPIVEQELANSIKNPFDLIIVSATFHEIYRHWNLEKLAAESESDDNFATSFFIDLVRYGLVDTGSVVLIGELYHRDVWPREYLEQARKIQFRNYNHADPPTSFPNPSTIIFGARGASYEEIIRRKLLPENPSFLNHTFELEHFDEGTSSPKGNKIYEYVEEIDTENPESEFNGFDKNAIKLIFENRRFAVLMFRWTGTKIKGMRRILPGQLIAESLNIDKKLVRSLQNLQSELGKIGEYCDVTFRKIYDDIFFESNKEAIFPILSDECSDLACDYFEFKKMKLPKRVVAWFSINSLIIQPSRYMLITENRKKTNEDFLPEFLWRNIIAAPCKGDECKTDLLLVMDDSKLDCRRSSNNSCDPLNRNHDVTNGDNEWCAIGFNHFMSEIQMLLKEMPSLGEIEAPSLFGYLVKLTNPPRSITLTYTQPNNHLQEAPSETLENAIEASTLDCWKVVEGVPWNTREDLYHKHLFALLDFCPSGSTARNTTVVLDDLTIKGYCRDGVDGEISVIGKIRERIKESVASLFLDFVFLRRFESDNAGENNIDTFINNFVERWTCSKNVRFIGSEQDVKTLLQKQEWNDFEVNKQLMILPRNIQERITKVSELAKGLKIELNLLPKAWITFSPTSLLPSRNNVSMAPGNIMLFTDRIYGAMLLDLLTVQVDKTFQAVRSIESEWKVAADEQFKAKQAIENAKVQELKRRDRAIAGFSHQSGHIFGEKSPYSFLGFIDKSNRVDDAHKLSAVWEKAGLTSTKDIYELSAREAQIRYANAVPNIIKWILKENVSDENAFGNTNEDKIDPFDLIGEVVGGMVIPLIRYVSAEKPGYGCAGKELSIRFDDETLNFKNSGIKVFVPSNELTKASIFEIFWNAFRHGSWKNTGVAEVVVKLSFVEEPGKPNALRFVATNPYEKEFKTDNRGLSYVEEFAMTLNRLNGCTCAEFECKPMDSSTVKASLQLPFIR